MAAAAMHRAKVNGYVDRCTFDTGYLETLSESGRFDCATALLVSQFILNEGERTVFFADIARRLKPGGMLAGSDPASDVNSDALQDLLEVWLRTMAASDVPQERVHQIREACARDVAILPAGRIQALVASAGFMLPVQFYQAGLIHAFHCRRQPS
jgi:tRNA (cmo5U34)-methyltransferase